MSKQASTPSKSSSLTTPSKHSYGSWDTKPVERTKQKKPYAGSLKGTLRERPTRVFFTVDNVP